MDTARSPSRAGIRIESTNALPSFVQAGRLVRSAISSTHHTVEPASCAGAAGVSPLFSSNRPKRAGPRERNQDVIAAVVDMKPQDSSGTDPCGGASNRRHRRARRLQARGCRLRGNERSGYWASPAEWIVRCENIFITFSWLDGKPNCDGSRNVATPGIGRGPSIAFIRMRLRSVPDSRVAKDRRKGLSSGQRPL
jgi:hypothetical protein